MGAKISVGLVQGLGASSSVKAEGMEMPPAPCSPLGRMEPGVGLGQLELGWVWSKPQRLGGRMCRLFFLGPCVHL